MSAAWEEVAHDAEDLRKLLQESGIHEGLMGQVYIKR